MRVASMGVKCPWSASVGEKLSTEAALPRGLLSERGRERAPSSSKATASGVGPPANSSSASRSTSATAPVAGVGSRALGVLEMRFLLRRAPGVCSQLWRRGFRRRSDCGSAAPPTANCSSSHWNLTLFRRPPSESRAALWESRAALWRRADLRLPLLSRRADKTGASSSGSRTSSSLSPTWSSSPTSASSEA